MELTVDYDPEIITLMEDASKIATHWLSDPQQGSIGGKAYLERLEETFDKVIEGETPLKMRLNFAHDHTVSVILAGMGYKQTYPTPLAATLFHELW